MLKSVLRPSRDFAASSRAFMDRMIRELKDTYIWHLTERSLGGDGLGVIELLVARSTWRNVSGSNFQPDAGIELMKGII